MKRPIACACRMLVIVSLCASACARMGFRAGAPDGAVDAELDRLTRDVRADYRTRDSETDDQHAEAIAPADLNLSRDAGKGPISACIAQCPQAAACIDANRDDQALVCYGAVSAAFNALTAGARLVIRAGVWREAASLSADNVEVLAEAGAHLQGAAIDGKAALVVQGNSAVIQGLECSAIRVPDGNGACIRAEGNDLTLRQVYFHDAEEGVSGDLGTTVIEDSTFERVGNGDFGQAIDVGGESLVVRRCRVLSSRAGAHEIKSRAAATLIEDSTIASLDAVDGRLIDVPHGGLVTIRGNTLEEGPQSENMEVLEIGMEGVTHAVNAISIEHNWIISDRPSVVWLVTVGMPAPMTRCNRTVGGVNPGWGGTHQHYATREEAGLMAYPILPDPPRGACP